MSNTWLTFDKRAIPFSELSQQHISNIYWYHKIFFPKSSMVIETLPELLKEIENRFNGQLLPYRPHTNFKIEIELLVKNHMLILNLNSSTELSYKYDIVYEEKVIGEYICSKENPLF